MKVKEKVSYKIVSSYHSFTACGDPHMMWERRLMIPFHKILFPRGWHN